VLLVEESYDRALARLHKRSMSLARNQASSAIEALRRAEQEMSAIASGGNRSAYVLSDSERAQQMRFALEKVIRSCCRRSLTIPTRITFPLPCCPPAAPTTAPDGSIRLGSRRQPGVTNCGLDAHLQAFRQQIQALCIVVRAQIKTPENTRRLEALNCVRKGQPLTDHHCRALGDAVFAICAPPGFLILTTNVRDHEPLARALGKVVAGPGSCHLPLCS